MATENLNFQLDSHKKGVTITGDGACLFRSISYLIFGTEAMFLDVRQAIILHVVKNWKYFSQMIYESQGHNCRSVAEYFAEMSKPFMQGGVPEIQAAVQVYDLVFEVYSGDKLYFRIGQEGRPVVILRYAEPLDIDNSNAYVMNNQLPLLETASSENLTHAHKMPDTVNCNITLNQDSSKNPDQKLPVNNPTWTGLTQTVHDLGGNDQQGISTSNKYCFIQQKPRKRYKPMTTRVHRKRFRQRLLIKEKILAYETTLQKEQEILRIRCRNEIEQNSNGPNAVSIKQEVEDINVDTIEIEEPNLIQIKQEPEFVNSDAD